MKELDGDFSARERIKHQQQRPALGGGISGRKIESVAVGRIGLHSHRSVHRAGCWCLGIRRPPNTKYHYCEKYGIQFHGNGLRNPWLSTNNTESREAATGEIGLKMWIGLCHSLLLHLLSQAQRTHVSPHLSYVSYTLFFCAGL